MGELVERDITLAPEDFDQAATFYSARAMGGSKSDYIVLWARTPDEVDPLVYLFARHRTEAHRKGFAEGKEAAAKVAETQAQIIGALPGSSIHSALDYAAQAIRDIPE